MPTVAAASGCGGAAPAPRKQRLDAVARHQRHRLGERLAHAVDGQPRTQAQRELAEIERRDDPQLARVAQRAADGIAERVGRREAAEAAVDG